MIPHNWFRWERSQVVRRQQFDPDWRGLFLNPFYFARKGLMEGLKNQTDTLFGNVLDVGCGLKPYQKLFEVQSYTGVELDSKFNRQKKQADFFYDGQTHPFPDGEFDGVLCSQVLEHVPSPIDFLKEINRVLKPGGVLLLTAPFVWDEHEKPHDFHRFTTFGIRQNFEVSGFEVTTIEKSVVGIQAVFQLFAAHLYKCVSIRHPGLRHLIQCLLTSPAIILAELLHRILPYNPDLFLDNIVVAKARK